MGFKTFTVFACRPPGYFGTIPKHSPAAAELLMDRLGLKERELVSESTEFNDYPKEHDLYIGAYPDGVAIAHIEVPAAFFDDVGRSRSYGKRFRDLEHIERTLLGLFPEGELNALILHSVVNLWGYANHQRGKMTRCASGAEGETYAIIGDPLPEEAEFLAQRSIENMVSDDTDFGEDLVFDVSRRVMGVRYDEDPAVTELKCSHYIIPEIPFVQRPSFLSRLFGAR